MSINQAKQVMNYPDKIRVLEKAYEIYRNMQKEL